MNIDCNDEKWHRETNIRFEMNCNKETIRHVTDTGGYITGF